MGIGESVVVKGELQGGEDLVVGGHVEGKIDLPHHQLTVAAGARIHAANRPEAEAAPAADEEGPTRVEGEPLGVLEPRLGRRASVAGKTLQASASHGTNDPGRRHFADAPVAGIAKVKVEVTGCVERYPGDIA